MRHVFRLVAVLIALVYLAGAVGGASIAWMCEGRVCSSDLARCCCASPIDVRDGTCLRTGGKTTRACQGACGCTSVVTKGFGLHVAPSAKAPAVVAFAVVPTLAPVAAFVPQAFVALDAPQVRPLPPPDRLPEPPCLAHASLRAPPPSA